MRADGAFTAKFVHRLVARCIAAHGTQFVGIHVKLAAGESPVRLVN